MLISQNVVLFLCLHICSNRNNCTADYRYCIPSSVRKDCCFRSVYLSHTLPLLLWLREATLVDFEDVAGLGQSNHRCPSWSGPMNERHRTRISAAWLGRWCLAQEVQGCVSERRVSQAASKNFPTDAGELSWLNLDFWSVNQRFLFVQWSVLGISHLCNCLCLLIVWLDFSGGIISN